VGKLLLDAEPLIYEGQTLTIEEGKSAGVSARITAPPKTQAAFVPRAAGKPKAGLGKPRAPALAGPPTTNASNSSSLNDGTSAGATSMAGQGQDDFRKLLG
jgi:hypothetical protein